MLNRQSASDYIRQYHAQFGGARSPIESAWKRDYASAERSPADNLVNAYRWHRVHYANGAPRYSLTKMAALALELARRDVAAGTPRYASGKHYAPTAKQDDGLVWVDTDRIGLRLVGEVDPEGGWNSGRHGKLGYFSDPYGDSARDGTGLVWGVVYQLPARNGVARFVAGYVYGGMGEGATLDLATVYTSTENDGSAQDCDAARDAARVADSMAESAAESEREYQCAWQAGSRYADLGEQAVSKLKDGEGETPTSPLWWNTRDAHQVAAFNDGAGIA